MTVAEEVKTTYFANIYKWNIFHFSIECASACGTRHFRTCCFNYLRKRSNIPPLQQEPPPGLKLELWLAKSQLARNYLNSLSNNNGGINSDWRHIEFEPISDARWKEKEIVEVRNSPKTSDNDLSGHKSGINDQASSDAGRLQLIYDS